MKTPAAPLVLVVEDGEETLELVSSLLVEEGYRVATARNGCEALAQLDRTSLPAVILLDLAMPVMSGFEVAAILSRDPVLRSVPVLVCTAEPAQRLGTVEAVGYVPKPVDVDVLLREVARWAGPAAGQSQETG